MSHHRNGASPRRRGAPIKAGKPKRGTNKLLIVAVVAVARVHPAIEQLRQQYEGRVTFVVRHFPLEGHFNSTRAAGGVEAAAQQGQFEAVSAAS
jgi:hypothetical protein